MSHPPHQTLLFISANGEALIAMMRAGNFSVCAKCYTAGNILLFMGSKEALRPFLFHPDRIEAMLE